MLSPVGGWLSARFSQWAGAGVFVGVWCAVWGVGTLRAAEPSANEKLPAGILARQFIYTTAPFPQAHASTLAETPSGLVAAWFGGTREGHADVGIWFSRAENGRWSQPIEVATGAGQGGERHPCWNPVLWQVPGGPLVLFYKVGPSPSQWWSLSKQSSDGGQTWSAAERLPAGILGPIKNKPLLLPGGQLLCGSSTEHQGWRVHFETWNRATNHWQATAPLAAAENAGAIQPTLFSLGEGKLLALCRPRNALRILATRSPDNGQTWTRLEPTALPNPNSGIDGVTLRDGRHVLVYNHTATGRSPLNLALSENGGEWQAAAILERGQGEYSYPAVVQTADGKLHITYTWRRQRVRHVIVDVAALALRPLVKGEWPE